MTSLDVSLFLSCHLFILCLVETFYCDLLEHQLIKSLKLHQPVYCFTLLFPTHNAVVNSLYFPCIFDLHYTYISHIYLFLKWPNSPFCVPNSHFFYLKGSACSSKSPDSLFNKCVLVGTCVPIGGSNLNTLLGPQRPFQSGPFWALALYWPEVQCLVLAVCLICRPWHGFRIRSLARNFLKNVLLVRLRDETWQAYRGRVG